MRQKTRNTVEKQIDNFCVKVAQKGLYVPLKWVLCLSIWIDCEPIFFDIGVLVYPLRTMTL